jgi:hypothetical protein
MKRMVLLVVLVMSVSACGGGGNTSNTAAPSETPAVTGGGSTDSPSTDKPDDTTTEDSLPEIVDNYYDDGMFRYKDVSLYEGSYFISILTPETCSIFFGIPWQTSMTFSDVTDADLDLSLEGNPYTFTAAAAGDMGENDILGYGGLYRGLGCAVAIGSFTVPDETFDMIGFACVTDDLSDSCGAVYERASDYDFTTTAIKSTGSGEVTSHAEAVINILHNVLVQAGN